VVSEAAAAASSHGETILIVCGILFPTWIISATVRMVFGFVLSDYRVALLATAPHEGEEY
jgi:hypothetical protein